MSYDDCEGTCVDCERERKFVEQYEIPDLEEEGDGEEAPVITCPGHGLTECYDC